MLLEPTGPLEYTVSVVAAVTDPVEATATVATVWPSIPVPELPLWLLTAGGVLVIVLLMAVSGFFSSSEIAMFALPRHRLEALVETGARNATVVEELRGDPHRLLVTILVGNNVANVAMSSVATALLGFYVSGAQAVLLTTVGITSLVLLFSESAPKSYAIENTESWALRVARPIRLSEHLLYPFVVVFDKLTRAVNGLVGAETAIESAYLTRRELQDLIAAGERAGAIEPDERDRLRRAFRFDELPVSEIMVPRPDVVAVSTTDSIEEALQVCAYSGFTHLPVYEDDLDTVVGTVHVCELLRERDYGARDPDDLALTDVMEPTIHVPETMPADDVLAEMQRAQTHIAIAIDEFGTTEGIVTTEDPTEVIVGEILRPLETVPIRAIDDRTAVVRGDVSVTEVNDVLDLELPEPPTADTVAGLVLDRAGRLPEPGERFTVDGVAIVVETVEDTRIINVRLTRTGSTTERER
ncbi:hemolysin family protein [Natrarchaeobius oligotrophus]|uniref:HlyC/CorC family transporter n=1 Tax=Natrarchaeobius chitinivorans TaxID=1679083 RepID=A0A3N6M7I4_NATCH|nr:hemolysin family protein [Natrarchaeobius chitinivorans]RQG99598.1 HlyC/CorC family transporter [Natrarchaeobius chitinivorans]